MADRGFLPSSPLVTRCEPEIIGTAVSFVTYPLGVGGVEGGHTLIGPVKWFDRESPEHPR